MYEDLLLIANRTGFVLFSETHCYKAFQKVKKVGCPNLPPRQSNHFESNRMTVKIPKHSDTN